MPTIADLEREELNKLIPETWHSPPSAGWRVALQQLTHEQPATMLHFEQRNAMRRS